MACDSACVPIYSPAGLEGSGGGGPGSFIAFSKEELNGVKGRVSIMMLPLAPPTPFTPFTLGTGVEENGGIEDVILDGGWSRRGSMPFTAIRDTRASSSCVSWIYSAGGRGINGGGAA